VNQNVDSSKRRNQKKEKFFQRTEKKRKEGVRPETRKAKKRKREVCWVSFKVTSNLKAGHRWSH